MKIVILGSGGRLGAALLREYRDKFDVAGFNHTQLNLSDLGAVREKLRNIRFDILIYAAGFRKVRLCDTYPARAFLINAEAPRVGADICYAKYGRMTPSTADRVFSRDRGTPCTE